MDFNMLRTIFDILILLGALGALVIVFSRMWDWMFKEKKDEKMGRKF